jgi:DNA polymerase
VGQAQKLVTWLREVLPPDGDGIKIMTKREEEEDDEGTITRPAKYSLTRSRIEKLIPYCEAIGGHKAKRALEIRMYGGSTTPAKYAKILAQEVDDCLYGQYVFNGAPQTGRASSRGVQIQNLARAFLPYEHEIIEAILGGAKYDEISHLGDDTPVLRKLALLIRPTFVPRETSKVFVVSDFAQIEARVLPWLAGDDSPGAMARLEQFRQTDADPSLPDLYQRTAATLSGVNFIDKKDPRRQRGKIAELALGFGGGAGALISMAAAQGTYFTEEEAKEIVHGWRRANQWCVRFWGKHTGEESYGLWGAANRAMEQPGVTHTAGRISFVFLPKAANTLYCELPSGRCLAYRGIKYERVADYDDDDQITGYSTKLRFWKGYTRSVIWHGTFCENVVQATAADLLRGTLVRCEDDGFKPRLHSHDEILCEVDEQNAPAFADAMRWQMRRGFDWTAGLPIWSDETIQPYYSKWEPPKAKVMEAAQ